MWTCASPAAGYKYYGLNRGEHEGKTGIWYREWAPGARVSLFCSLSPLCFLWCLLCFRAAILTHQTEPTGGLTSSQCPCQRVFVEWRVLARTFKGRHTLTQLQVLWSNMLSTDSCTSYGRPDRPGRPLRCCFTPQALALVGEFNNWDPKPEHWGVKNDFGVFQLFLPDSEDGTLAIPHRQAPDGVGAVMAVQQ